jgi:hypothetical protein
MSALSNSRRLRKGLEPALPEVFAITGGIVSHPRFRELYPEFLITLHQLVRATVPVMQTSLRRCRELADADPVAAAMVPYYEHHIKEEMHHDEWTLEDLELIGVPREEVLRRMPPPAVASFIGAQYYWILHHHPVAQLGQIAFQEGYPPTPEAVDQMVERSGYPRAAFRTIEKHGHLDPNHRDDFDDALDRMPLAAEHHAILLTSALHAARMAARVYGGVVRRAAVPERRSGLVAEPAGDAGDFRLTDLDGSSYRIGEQEQFLLTQCDGRQGPDEVCRAFGDRFGEPLSRPELEEFLDQARAEHWFVEEGV